MVLSLDVIYHLVEQPVFESHIRRAFSSARRVVVLYTSDGPPMTRQRWPAHIRHRKVTDAVARLAPDWSLSARLPNPRPYIPDDLATTFAEFFIYEPAPTRARGVADA
jgi:hypothetical protein